MLATEITALYSVKHVCTFVELFSADRLISVQYLKLCHDRFTSETDSVADDTTRLRAASLAITGKANRLFSCSQYPDRAWTTQLPTQWVSAAFLEVRRQGREADHSTPSSVELKNTWIYTSAPWFTIMVWTRTTLPVRNPYFYDITHPHWVLTYRSFKTTQCSQFQMSKCPQYVGHLHPWR
jgi:hypothetical protein